MRERYPSIVVGIDLSGDPTKGKFADFKHIFERARCLGFGLALHCAETDDYGEILEMLEFMEGRDRIGHGTFIDGERKIWNITHTCYAMLTYAKLIRRKSTRNLETFY